MATTTPMQQSKMTSRTKLALWLMIAPTALLIISFVAYAVANWLLSTMAPIPSEGELFGGSSTPAGSVIINIILFIVGVVGTISWLPGLIVGTVLLATAKKA